jgi:hypothetical protein
MTMSETVTPTGTVHWIGTGLSTGSGLRVLADNARRLLVWGRTGDRAAKCLARLGLTGRAEARPYDLASFAAQLRRGDVVISMLPATEHGELLKRCVERRAHFACSSYASDAIIDQVPAAERSGIVVLTEAGLDPGIDHLFADLLVARGRAVVGPAPATAEFTSYCGGLPAVPNEFRYRFSWAPLGVLRALCAPARYVENGASRTVEAPWTATRRRMIGNETFEVYPNRDSIPYITQYGFPSSWRLNKFVRGTVRLEGWRDAWAEVFVELRRRDEARIAALAEELAGRYPTTEADRDRVVLAVGLTLHTANGLRWRGTYLLDTLGDADESAMARCVSTPLSFGVTEILTGALHAGLHQAAQSAHDAKRWVAFLTEHGIPCRFSESCVPTPSLAAAGAAGPASQTRQERLHERGT